MNKFKFQIGYSAPILKSSIIGTRMANLLTGLMGSCGGGYNLQVSYLFFLNKAVSLEFDAPAIYMDYSPFKFSTGLMNAARQV
jgi:hypothetical protein